MTKSVFAKYQSKSYPYRYTAELVATNLWGATPSDPNVAEGWLRTKMKASDDVLRQMVYEVMLEREMSEAEAVEALDRDKHLLGFRRDPERGGELYLEGRCLKAGLKEAVSVAANEGKIKQGRAWGGSDVSVKKGLLSWFPEHVFVVEDRVYLGVKEPDAIDQSFIHKVLPGKGPTSSIQYNERIDEATLSFTVETDHNFAPEEWAMIWTTGERQGLGAGRSQGHGTYVVTRWEQIK